MNGIVMKERKTLPINRRVDQSVVKNFRQLNRWSHGWAEILVNTIDSFNDHRVTQAAASMGYYTIFSIFPLLGTILLLGSRFVDRHEVQKMVTQWVQEFIPFAADFVIENLSIVFNISNIVGVIAVGGLIWSATTVFYILVYNINLPWSKAKARQPLKNRFVSLVIIALMLMGLVLSTMVSTFVDVLNNLLPFLDLLETPLWTFLLGLTPFMLRFLVFFGLYRWVPDVKVRNRSAMSSALIVMLVLEATSQAFIYMVQTGLVRYQAVYGTLGTIMTLMLWIYINFVVILFGAHLTHAVEVFLDQQRRGRRNLEIQGYPYLLKKARNYNEAHKEE
jgi:membrane protein